MKNYLITTLELGNYSFLSSNLCTKKNITMNTEIINKDCLNHMTYNFEGIQKHL